MKQYPELCVEARGKGLLIGLEFRSNEVGQAVAKKLFDHKILVAATLMDAQIIRIEPPLNVTYEHMDTLVKALAIVLQEI